MFNKSRLLASRGAIALFVCVLLSSAFITSTSQLRGQDTSTRNSASSTVQGKVVDSLGQPVNDAIVTLQGKKNNSKIERRTDLTGTFLFADLPLDSYVLSANKSDQFSSPVPAISPSAHNPTTVVLTLRGAGKSSSQGIQFSDGPDFTIAGVTDWTAVGGHGSDATLRASESLARETITLKPKSSTGPSEKATPDTTDSKAKEEELRAAVKQSTQSFTANYRLGDFYLCTGRYQEALPFLQEAHEIDAGNVPNEIDLTLALKDTGDLRKAQATVLRLLTMSNDADVHRVAGEVEEGAGDSLAAVRQFESAARLDPSEQNYFEWGSELLIHRAVWQAVDVFKSGVNAHPQSARMLTALGASLFAVDLYDEAGAALCKASDLNPGDIEPYLFMGKVEIAAPLPIACVEPHIATFVREHPDNALANYYYAMILLKKQEHTPDSQYVYQAKELLTKATIVDTRCTDAYLQLGIIYFGQHDYAKAIGFFAKAIKADPESGEAHYRLGVVLDRTGEHEKAKAEFLAHDAIEQKQAAEVERQRRQVKQFLVVLQAKPVSQEKDN